MYLQKMIFGRVVLSIYLAFGNLYYQGFKVSDVEYLTRFRILQQEPSSFERK
jgi:hypothetical protein